LQRKRKENYCEKKSEKGNKFEKKIFSSIEQDKKKKIFKKTAYWL